MSNNTNWIYNNYEFENRINNLSWTISGNYDEDMDTSEKDYSSKDVSLYFAIVAGARRKFLDWNIIKKYIMSRMKKGYDKDILMTLIQIVLNCVVENKVINERPGVEEIRNKAYSDILVNYNKIHKEDILEVLKYTFILESVENKVINERPGVEEIRNKAYSDILVNYNKIHKEDILEVLKYTFILESMDRHPAVDGLTRRIINDIKTINCSEELINILKRLDEIYLTYFEHIMNSQQQEKNINDKQIKNVNVDFDTFSDFMYEELYMDEESTESIESEINNISNSMLVENLGEMNDINLEKSPNRTIYVDETMTQKIYEKRK